MRAPPRSAQRYLFTGRPKAVRGRSTVVDYPSIGNLWDRPRRRSRVARRRRLSDSAWAARRLEPLRLPRYGLELRVGREIPTRPLRGGLNPRRDPVVTPLGYVSSDVSRSNPSRIVRGCGGQPGMNRSTGTMPAAPFATSGWSTYGPPEIAQAPTAITTRGGGTAR